MIADFGFWIADCRAKILNVEHSTLNIERRMEKIRYWFSLLEVESWKFDVSFLKR
jgi:hypothetical protein